MNNMEKIPKQTKTKTPISIGGGSSGSNNVEQKPRLTEEEKLDWYVNFAKMLIYNNYGIELTNTEYLHLRSIAKESVTRQDYTSANTSLWARERFYAEYEIPLLFLQKMYGISALEIPTKWVVSILPDGAEFKFNNKIEAERKKEDLKQQGYQIWLRRQVTATDDFKKYLKRMRESHGFEDQFN